MGLVQIDGSSAYVPTGFPSTSCKTARKSNEALLDAYIDAIRDNQFQFRFDIVMDARNAVLDRMDGVGAEPGEAVLYQMRSKPVGDETVGLWSRWVECPKSVYDKHREVSESIKFKFEYRKLAVID